MRKTFFCIDGHTCGNPVRLIAGGAPVLRGISIMEKRLHFMEEYDWIRTSLMYEPRGHDMMSGSMLFPPTDPENDAAILFLETSGCLPMCGHGTIGTITFALEEGLITPKRKGHIRCETPAGLVAIEYKEVGNKIKSVKLKNIASFLHSSNIVIQHSVLGELHVDVSYGGNFYAIVDPQPNFKGIEHHTAGELISWSNEIRHLLNLDREFIHPEDKNIKGMSHVLWTGDTLSDDADARNAVFYGSKAIDRSPCGTGTSARMAQWYAKGKLKLGDSFVHESFIGSKFNGVVEDVLDFYGYKAIIPSIEGWARITGYNTIHVDPEDDPFAFGFQVI